MTIRRAKIKDIPKMASLAVNLLKYHEKIDPYFAPAKDSLKAYKKYFKKCIYYPKALMLVVEVDKEIVAYALGEVRPRPPVYKIKNRAIINDMYVKDSFQGQGIAEKFLEELTIWFKEQKKKCPDMKSIELSIYAKNETERKAWKKHGFKEFMSKQRIDL